MNWTVVLPLALVALAACSSSTLPGASASGPRITATAADPTTRVAWGQRVALGVGNRPVGGVKVNGAPVAWTGASGQVVFDLPPPPNDPLPPLSDAPAAYTDRAPARAEVFGPGAATPFLTRTWAPYGSVVPGEVNVLLNGSCPVGEIFAGLVVVNRYAAGGLCFLTLDVGRQDTFAAIQTLKDGPSDLAVSRNVLFSMDQGGTPNSYDPSCGQTRRHLDPSAKGYDLIEGENLASLVGAGAGGHTGSGVTVAVIGGGVNPNQLGNPPELLGGLNFVNPGQPTLEAFACDLDRDGTFDLGGHDTHVAAIIHALAPKARILPLKTCNAVGDCRSAYSAMALMALMNPPYAGKVIANMSQGGPLPDLTHFELLRRPELLDPARFLLVASAGNQRAPVLHYPAGYAPGAAAPGSLANVVAVGAFGQTGPGAYGAAVFNTAGNFELLAPGVNVCTGTAAQFRCQAGAAYPDNLGLGGTSYAAPAVAAVAALYAEARPGQNLRGLLMGRAKTDVRGTTVGRVQFTP